MVCTALVTAAFLLSALAAPPAAPEAEKSAPASAEHAALLRRADVGSAAPPSFRAILLLRAKGRPEGGRIEVWRSREDRTLVRFLDPRERGKYLLYTEGELWFLAPGARKPVKLPTSFRIQGAATLDDILGRRYSRDYRIRSVGESGGDGRRRVEFRLEALAEKAPFPTILYVVDPATGRPERAEFRLRSGRLATVLEFEQWLPGRRLTPRLLTLEDALKGGSATEAEVVVFEEREIPAGLFNRNDGTERMRLEAEPRP
jgi:hypothetical protein